MRHNRVIGRLGEFSFKVHGYGVIGAKADALIKYGVCFLDKGIKVPDAHVLSSRPFFSKLLENTGNEKIIIAGDQRKQIEKVLEGIEGNRNQVFRSSFQGDLAGNGVYTSVYAPLTEGIDAIETIVNRAAGEDAREFREKRGLSAEVSVLIMPPVIDAEFDAPLISGCGFTSWSGENGRLAVVSGMGTRATGKSTPISRFRFDERMPEDLIRKLTTRDLQHPERLVNGKRITDPSEPFVSKLVQSGAYQRAVNEALPRFLSDIKEIEKDIGPFYFEFALARGVNEVRAYLLQVAPYERDTRQIVFPDRENENCLWTTEVAGRNIRRANSVISTLQYDLSGKEMRERMIRLNRENRDYILVVHDIHSAMAGPGKWLSYAAFSNAVAIVEVNPNHQHRTPTEHFQGLLRDSQIPFFHIDWLTTKRPFRIQELSEFKAHKVRAKVIADDSCIEGPLGAIEFEELPKLDRPQDLPDDDGYSR